MELNPQVVFERMFGDGSTVEQRAARRKRDRSILDSLTGSLSRLRSECQRRRSRAARRLHGERPRDRAPAADCDEGLDRRAGRYDRAGRACRRPSTSTSSCSSICWRWPSRPTSPASARCSSPATSPAGPTPRARRPRWVSTAGRITAKIRGESTSSSKINQYHVKMLALSGRQAGQDPGRRRHAAGSFAGSLRQQHGELQSAPSLRCAARADRRIEREAQRRPPSGLSDQDGADRQSALERAGQVRHSPGQHRRQHGPAG